MRTVRFAACLVLALILPLTPTASASESGDFHEYVVERATHHGLTVEAYLDALRTQELLAPIVQLVRSDPESFGGIYWDWSAPTPGFVVQYVGATPPDLGTNMRYVRVERSRAALDAVVQRLDGLSESAATSSGWVSLGIDEVNNTVRVGLADRSAPVLPRLAELGNAVTVQFGEPLGTPSVCNTRTDCTPHRGGIQINGDVYSCTFGANARRNGLIVTITSGHCDTARNNEWDVWRHPNTQGLNQLVGTSHANGLHNGMDVDVLRIGAVGPQTKNPYNRIYSSNANKAQAITGVMAQGNMFVGLSLRRAGQNTSKNGEVTSGLYKYWFSWDGGIWAAWGIRSSADSVGGDSGGPVWHYNASGGAVLLGFNSLQDGTFAAQDDASEFLASDGSA